MRDRGLTDNSKSIGPRLRRSKNSLCIRIYVSSQNHPKDRVKTLHGKKGTKSNKTLFFKTTCRMSLVDNIRPILHTKPSNSITYRRHFHSTKRYGQSSLEGLVKYSYSLVVDTTRVANSVVVVVVVVVVVGGGGTVVVLGGCYGVVVVVAF